MRRKSRPTLPGTRRARRSFTNVYRLSAVEQAAILAHMLSKNFLFRAIARLDSVELDEIEGPCLLDACIEHCARNGLELFGPRIGEHAARVPLEAGHRLRSRRCAAAINSLSAQPHEERSRREIDVRHAIRSALTRRASVGAFSQRKMSAGCENRFYRLAHALLEPICPRRIVELHSRSNSRLRAGTAAPRLVIICLRARCSSAFAVGRHENPFWRLGCSKCPRL